MRIPCAMIRDLLPLYAEKMVENETESLIREHLEGCEDCRRKLNGIEAGAEPPVDTAKPLQTLKREIRRRRWYAAVMAALFAFVAVFTVFFHVNEESPVPWEAGLIEVKGIEERPYEEVFGDEAAPDASQGPTVQALILRADSRINGVRESLFVDEDGATTVVVQGWTTHGSGSLSREFNEMAFCPVPDRLIYDGGDQQTLLWGEPMSGGVVELPRLALGYYAILAIALALILGTLWLLLRKRERSWIVRQAFFAPVSWLAAHLLIKGFRTTSFFMARDFLSLLAVACALYALISLMWQVLLRRKREQ